MKIHFRPAPDEEQFPWLLVSGCIATVVAAALLFIAFRWTGSSIATGATGTETELIHGGPFHQSLWRWEDEARGEVCYMSERGLSCFAKEK
jgi:hypothetical protein